MTSLQNYLKHYIEAMERVAGKDDPQVRHQKQLIEVITQAVEEGTITSLK